MSPVRVTAASRRPTLIPLAEVACRLGVSPRTVLRWHARDGLPLVRATHPHRPAWRGDWRLIERWVRARPR